MTRAATPPSQSVAQQLGGGDRLRSGALYTAGGQCSYTYQIQAVKDLYGGQRSQAFSDAANPPGDR